MTPQEINIAIAKACGWSLIEHDDGLWSAVDADGHLARRKCGISKEHAEAVCVDNYHGDLNAMHEAENWLLKGPLTDMLGMNYWNNVWLAAKDDFKTLRTIGNATADQRAEAFLRTLGLWKDVR